MKKLLIALLLTTVSTTLFAQLKPYQPNPVLDKFVGTWIAQRGKNMVTITIKKIQEPVMNSKMDFLAGYLLHKDNDQILEESANPLLTVGINYASNGEMFQDKVFFNYFDQKKGKSGKLILILSKANPNEFTTQLVEVGDVRVVTPSTPYKKIEMGFTFPNGLVFNKKQ